MASTAAVAARRAVALERLRAAADIAQAAGGLAISEPKATKDPEIDRIQWIEYAADVLQALNAKPLASETPTPTDDAAEQIETPADDAAAPRAKRKTA